MFILPIDVLFALAAAALHIGMVSPVTGCRQEVDVRDSLHQRMARGASVGFALIDGRLRFDQEPQCGPIAEGPAIMTLKDVDSLTDGATLFSRVEQRCLSHEPVRLRTDSSSCTISLPCTVASPRPVEYRLTRIPSAVAPLNGASPTEQHYPLTSTAGLRLHNVTATPVRYEGKLGVRVVEASSAGPADAEQPTETLALLDGTDFGDGVIELEVAGAPAPGASGSARGFVGLAFRVQPDRRSYDAFYLRPANGRVDDQVRRNHTVQYIAHPNWPWERLRRESPDRYESYVDLVPGVWTRVRIKVRGATARLFVHGQSQPTLIINDVKFGATARGALALWIGPGTVAHFRNLRVRRSAPA